MTGQQRVLIVDDEPGLASLFGAWLEPRYEVRYETDGAGALAAIETGIDAVVLDRQMPGLSGDEVLMQLRDRGDQVPVSLVTALEPDPDAFELPFDEYLLKPVTREELLSTAERLLALSELDTDGRRCVGLAAKLQCLATQHSLPAETRDQLSERFQNEFVAAAERTPTPVAELPLAEPPLAEPLPSELRSVVSGAES